MFRLSKNLKIFCGLFFLYTIIFRYILSFSITNHRGILLWSAAIAYGVIIFFTALFLGKAEDSGVGVVYLGFRYHLATYLVFGVVSVAWFLLGFNSQYEKLSMVFIIMGIWFILLLMNFLMALSSGKNAIRGIPPEDVFD